MGKQYNKVIKRKRRTSNARNAKAAAAVQAAAAKSSAKPKASAKPKPAAAKPKAPKPEAQSAQDVRAASTPTPESRPGDFRVAGPASRRSTSER